MASRRSADKHRSIGEYFTGMYRWQAQYQNHYSLASAGLALVLVVTLISDLLAPHPGIRLWPMMLWLVGFGVFSVLPLIFGAEYPKWAGFSFVTYLTCWAAFFLLHPVHPHMEINALLEAPMVAIFVGWMYRPVTARIMLCSHLLVLTLVMLLRTPDPYEDFSSYLALMYAVLIAFFCLETGVILRRSAEEESVRDSLTGVFNRRGLQKYGVELLEIGEKESVPVSFAVMDLDDFKRVNDVGGHAEGDRVLRYCSELWANAVGEQGFVVRLGGDEFALMMRIEESAAEAMLAKLRAESEQNWSWGTTQFTTGDTIDSMLFRADEALYQRKPQKSLGNTHSRQI